MFSEHQLKFVRRREKRSNGQRKEGVKEFAFKQKAFKSDGKGTDSVLARNKSVFKIN